ncbi:MAG: hypothetical protein PVI90_00705 [Desulfobacteraceae bacterium]|jgi:hypothetical protein
MPTLLDFVKFINRAYVTYGCDSFGNDTVGNLIWENLNSDKDIIKGDGVTVNTFPTFVSNSDHNVEYYEFDGSNNYVSNWPDMPANYTVVAALSISYPDGKPSIFSCNDDALEIALTTPGAISGNIHSILIFDWVLSPLELVWCEQWQLRRLWRDTFVDPFTARLIRGGDCELCFYHEEEADAFDDYSLNNISSTAYSIDWNSGLTFPDSDSALVMDSDSNLNLDELTIFIESPNFDLEPSSIGDTILENGTNYTLSIKDDTTQLFLGLEYASGEDVPYNNIHYLSNFIALHSGILKLIGIYCNYVGNIKLNLYEIVGGVPTNLIWADDVGISCSVGMNYINVTSEDIRLEEGKIYALGAITDSALGTITTTNVTSNDRHYRTGLNYATFTAPDPITGYVSQTIAKIYNYNAYGYLDTQMCEITINGSSFSFPAIGYRTLAISCKNGEKPLFYLNGRFAGQGDSIATVSSAGAGQLTIGNNTARNNPFSSILKKLSIYSTSLSDAEIRAAHIMALADRPFTV